MLKKIAALIIAVIGSIFIMALGKPDTFEVKRSADIHASPEKIFTLINDFHQWPNWSPWDKLDPNMKKTYSGAESGPGAVYEWDGNKDVGQGRMEMTASSPFSNITIKLDFIKPFKSQNTTQFAFQSTGEITKADWVMSGSNNFLSKLMGVFCNMDKMIGKDFETGLANLKNLSEK